VFIYYIWRCSYITYGVRGCTCKMTSFLDSTHVNLPKNITGISVIDCDRYNLLVIKFQPKKFFCKITAFIWNSGIHRHFDLYCSPQEKEYFKNLTFKERNQLLKYAPKNNAFWVEFRCVWIFMRWNMRRNSYWTGIAIHCFNPENRENSPVSENWFKIKNASVGNRTQNVDIT